MTKRYRFTYGADTVYGRVVELVQRLHAGAESTVVDLGCGYGAVAESLRDLGLSYLGVDADDDAVLDLKGRGFDAFKADLLDVDRTVQLLIEQLSGRVLGAILMVDSLEHLTNGAELLRELAALAATAGGAPLVLSIPNVTHIDIGAKLLMGRWDVSETGLLDATHVAFFSERRLEQVTSGSGWVQIGAADFSLPESDQHFPEHTPALEAGTPLREFLLRLRSDVGGGAIVNQFVRAYAPMPRTAEITPAHPSLAETAAPFLSVLLRTQGRRIATLQETLLSLAAQRDQDFEVIVLAHDMQRDRLADLRYLADGFGEQFSGRVRIVPVDGGGRSRPLNVGVEEATGTYVAILDDDDVVFGHWIEAFKATAGRAPGKILRTVPAEQDIKPVLWADKRPGYAITSRPRCPWPKSFDAISHIFENSSPPCCYAVPRSAFVDLGLRFDESLPVLEDWDILVRAALLAGVSDIDKVTSLWRRWQEGGDSSMQVHTVKEWERARSAVVAKLDRHALLLPKHSVTTIHELKELVRTLQNERHQLELAADNAARQVDEVRRSTSWKLTAPVRAMGRLARRFASKA